MNYTKIIVFLWIAIFLYSQISYSSAPDYNDPAVKKAIIEQQKEQQKKEKILLYTFISIPISILLSYFKLVKNRTNYFKTLFRYSLKFQKIYISLLIIISVFLSIIIYGVQFFNFYNYTIFQFLWNFLQEWGYTHLSKVITLLFSILIIHLLVLITNSVLYFLEFKTTNPKKIAIIISLIILNFILIVYLNILVSGILPV